MIERDMGGPFLEISGRRYYVAKIWMKAFVTQHCKILIIS